MKMKQFVGITKDFWEGAFSFIDEDMPDGAYFQMHVDIAETLMKDCCKHFGIKNVEGDGHDLYMEYLELTNGS